MQTETPQKMRPELIKTLISNATERQHGLTLRLTNILGKTTEGEVVIRNAKPGVAVVKEDGRVGFNVNGASYMTANGESGNRFLTFLEEANEKGLKKIDYGQPRNCFFHRLS